MKGLNVRGAEICPSTKRPPYGPVVGTSTFKGSSGSGVCGRSAAGGRPPSPQPAISAAIRPATSFDTGFLLGIDTLLGGPAGLYSFKFRPASEFEVKTTSVWCVIPPAPGAPPCSGRSPRVLSSRTPSSDSRPARRQASSACRRGGITRMCCLLNLEIRCTRRMPPLPILTQGLYVGRISSFHSSACSSKLISVGLSSGSKPAVLPARIFAALFSETAPRASHFFTFASLPSAPMMLSYH